MKGGFRKSKLEYGMAKSVCLQDQKSGEVIQTCVGTEDGELGR